MAINFSYSLGINTKDVSSISNLVTGSDEVDLLQRSLATTLPTGKVLKLDLELVNGIQKTINITNLGINYVRLLFLRGDNVFGYKLNNIDEWKLVKSILLDFDQFIPPTGLSTGTVYSNPNSIVLENPLPGSTNLQLFIIGT